MQDTNYIEAPEPREYPKLSVKLYGKGVQLDTPANGALLRMKRHQIAQSGQVILSEIWGKKGAIGLVPPAGAGALCTSHFFLFNLRRDRVDPAWLESIFAANYLKEQLGANARGTTGYAAVRPKHLMAALIPLPSLPDQRRIVARIGQTSQKVAEASRVRAAAQQELRVLRAGLIARLIRGLDVRGRLEDVLLEKPRNGWSARCDNADGGTAVLALSAVTGFGYRSREFKRTSAPVDPAAHYWLQRGDLLITRSNTPDLVGHASIYDGTPSPCIYPDLMMKLVPDPRLASVEFVHLWLQARPARDHVRSLAKGTSPSMKKISQGTVRRIPFPSGVSLIEQERVVALWKRANPLLDALAGQQAEVARTMDSVTAATLATLVGRA